MLALATATFFGAAPPLGGDSSITPPRTTPAMAWNAWNTFSVNGVPMRGGRAEYESVAEAMLASGMVAAGYTLVSTVCTGWTGRDPVTHKLQENLTAWPGGMASFADYLHGKGMQLSVYSDAGARNCCGEPGILGYEEQDVQQFADWGLVYSSWKQQLPCHSPSASASHAEILCGGLAPTILTDANGARD